MSSSTVEQLTLNQLVAGSIPSSPISFQGFQYLTLPRSCLNRRNILEELTRIHDTCIHMLAIIEATSLPVIVMPNCYNMMEIRNGYIHRNQYVCGDRAFYRLMPDMGNGSNAYGIYTVTNGIERFNGWFWYEPEYGIFLKQEQVGNSNCSNCPSSVVPPAYDAISGSCVLSSIHNTPGRYNSMESCLNSLKGDPGLVCIPAAEFSQIEELAAALKDSVC